MLIKNLYITFLTFLVLALGIVESKSNDSIFLPIVSKIEVLKQQGKFQEAFLMNKKLMHLKDSITELNRANLLAEMQEGFELENKVKRLELLNAQNALNEQQIRVKKQQQFAFVGGAILLLIISVGLRNRIVTIRKIKDLIQSKNEILQQERIKATNSERFKNEFLANVSHEIRTPMNAIMGITNILIKNKHLEEQEKFLEAMHVSSKNLLVLINDILDLSKLEAGKVEIEKTSFKIKEVIEKIEGDLKGKAEEKGLELKVETNPDVPEILLGDPQMLHNILFPMVNNGIAFTDKGAVSLMCKVEGHTDNSYIIGFSIQDTGIGIVKEKLDQILNTFVKVYEKDAINYDGSGLELPIIKQMIELQGGTIEVESESGKGTTFNIEIPYSSSTNIEEQGITGPQSDLVPQSDLSILLVEDNEFNVMVATEEINSAFENVNLEIVENGKLAFEKVLENDFHVILMDIQMPIMNGYEATKQIRKIKGPKASVPIIAMTANVMKQEIDKCFESGMDAYISKPFETSELINKINTLVARGN